MKSKSAISTALQLVCANLNAIIDSLPKNEWSDLINKKIKETTIFLWRASMLSPEDFVKEQKSIQIIDDAKDYLELLIIKGSFSGVGTELLDEEIAAVSDRLGVKASKALEEILEDFTDKQMLEELLFSND